MPTIEEVLDKISIPVLAFSDYDSSVALINQAAQRALQVEDALGSHVAEVLPAGHPALAHPLDDHETVWSDKVGDGWAITSYAAQHFVITLHVMNDVDKHDVITGIFTLGTSVDDMTARLRVALNLVADAGRAAVQAQQDLADLTERSLPPGLRVV